MEILPVEVGCLSAKQHVIQLIKIVKFEDSYFSEFMMYFYMIQTPIQRSILSYIVKQVGGTKWEDLLSDEYRWRDLVKCILLYYSGTTGGKGVVQPNREELVKQLAAYARSDERVLADAEVLKEPKKTFSELMEEVGSDGI
jgi:hypothetical protein